ncbi:hypothetical protein LTR09_006915 [Extremus antarcticus]|uniref:Pre-mRNA polyadenylation factor Fip1 domain-containing protein n=1 Tax=Extremus antarcticus TaxID=702011 RepID=A0AAJ0GDA8_9PEZI|nr:hypothetical protein LTR09_006915 [Extremus antarcticus]
MEEEDDDFYGGAGANAQEYETLPDHGNIEEEQKMDVSAEQDDDEEDSDDDVQFTLEKPKGDKTESRSAPAKKQKVDSSDHAASTDIKAARSGTPIKQEQPQSGSAQPTAIKSTLTHDGKEGKDFPEVRSSKVEVDSIPTWPANGKPITEVDIDADLAEHSKPWRLPGTDQTDFFNYGFDEYTWAQYCIRQQTMAGNISDMKQQDAQMKAMFGGGPGGGQGGGPPGMPQMPGMPGMPSPEEMMQQMMQSGMDPSDPNAFMQMMMGGGMPGGGGGPGQQNQQGGGGFNQQRGPSGGFGGSNPNSVSPHPQGGQGFQPPTGPSAQNQQGDQGGFGGGMDGYSPQQLAIMQQGQGGGRGRGRGRGRYY